MRPQTHTQLIGGRAAPCQVYPDAFCEVICETIMEERKLEKDMHATIGRLGFAYTKSRDITPLLQRLVLRLPHAASGAYRYSLAYE